MKPVFRSVMFGFHKEDVTDFLLRQDRAHQEELAKREAAYQAQTAQRDAAFQAEIARLNALLKTHEEDAAFVAKQKEEIGSLLSELKQVRERVQSLSRELSDAAQEDKEVLQALKTELYALRDANEKLALCQEKAKRLDQLAGVLSSLVSSREGGAGEVEAQEAPADIASVSDESLEMVQQHLEKASEAVQEVAKLLG